MISTLRIVQSLVEIVLRTTVKYVNGENLTQVTHSENITVEHTTPKDWMNLCSMCYEFRHAKNDPIMLSITSGQRTADISSHPIALSTIATTA